MCSFLFSPVQMLIMRATFLLEHFLFYLVSFFVWNSKIFKDRKFQFGLQVLGEWWIMVVKPLLARCLGCTFRYLVNKKTPQLTLLNLLQDHHLICCRWKSIFVNRLDCWRMPIWIIPYSVCIVFRVVECCYQKIFFLWGQFQAEIRPKTRKTWKQIEAKIIPSTIRVVI